MSKYSCFKIKGYFSSATFTVPFTLILWIQSKYTILKDKYPNFEVGLKCIIMVF